MSYPPSGMSLYKSVTELYLGVLFFRLVRTATIPALGTLITDCDIQEVHAKAYMQLQTYITDTNLRDNHTLLRQLVVTLGCIASSCSEHFRNEGKAYLSVLKYPFQIKCILCL